MSDAPLDSNVLRKVASLTLDKATIEQRVSKPKFVPEKLDFQIYEKFEGQSLYEILVFFNMYKQKVWRTLEETQYFVILTILLLAVFCMAASTAPCEDVANFGHSAFSGQAHATVTFA